MPNVNAVLNQQITRLSRRVVNASSTITRKLVAQHRRDLAALKRQIAVLTKRLSLVEKKQPKEITVSPEVLETGRFRAIGVKAHRAKLGLSAKLYGQLVGVSGKAIFLWEWGKATPRQAQKAKWLAIRGLGKREALERLGMGQSKAAPDAKPTGKKRKRGKFAQTAEEMILGLLKGRKALTSRQINEKWKKQGRAGNADNTLSLMTKAKKLKRVKSKGERGSLYRVG